MLCEVLFLSASLSADALGIGASYGMRGIAVDGRANVIIFSESLFITALSLLFGKLLSGLMGGLAPLVGVFILIFMGIWILLQSAGGEEAEVRPAGIFEKIRGITLRTFKKPEACDFDDSKSIDPIEAVYLGVVLSIDAFGAGTGMSAAGFYSPWLPFFTAFWQLSFLNLGKLFGGRLKGMALKGNTGNILSGAVLILMGILRMVHLFL